MNSPYSKTHSIDIPVIVLAGGLGTRLQSVIPNIPKLLAPIGSMSFLEILLRWLKQQNVQQVIFSLGYCAEKIIDALTEHSENNSMAIDYIVEKTPLGTLGGLSLALNEKDIAECLVLNGDTFVNIKLYDFLHEQREMKNHMSLITTRVEDISRYGAVEFKDDLFVRSFIEKKQGESCSGWINAGIYYFSDPASQDIKQFKKGSIETEFLTKNYKNLSYFKAGNVKFIDIGTPESYRRAVHLFKEFL